MADQFIGLDWTDGSAIHVHEIVEALRQVGNRVSLVTYRRPPYVPGALDKTVGKPKLSGLPMRALSVRIYSFVRAKIFDPLFGNWKAIWRGLKISREIYKQLMASPGWDIIHERLAPVSLGGILAARRLDIPFVLEVNAQLLEEQAAAGGPGLIYWVVASWIMQYTFSRASTVVAVSRELADYYTGKYHLEPQKVFVMPNAANLEQFDRAFDKVALKKKYNIPLEKSVVIMFVGNFKPWHGIELLIDAFALALSHVPDAQLVIAGDGAVRATLEERCRSKDIHTSVLFTGMVPHANIAELMAIGDIGVVPLLPDPIRTGAIKVFEYMAAGMAVVASDLSQLSEVLEGGRLGYLVEPGNVDQLAHALIELARNADERKSLGQKGRNAAFQKHTWSENARRLSNIYAGSFSSDNAPL